MMMKSTSRRSSARVAVLLALMPAAWSAQSPAATPEAPDPAVHAALSSLANAPDDSARRGAWEQVRAAANADRTAFIQGLVHFARDAKETPGAMPGAMVSGAVIKELELSPREVIRAVVPLLESTDEAVKAQAANLLGGYEQLAADRTPDFSYYRELIAETVEARADLPQGLIAHMYATSPGTALLTMMRAQGIREPARLKEILWAEHVVSDSLWKQDYGFLQPTDVEPAAMEQLRKLAADSEWWVRLYPVEIMRQRPAFQDRSLVEALQSDEHPLVRATATRAAALAPPKN
jgi:hypothetical protein